jgi:large subunit ribosomal protein L21
MYAVIKTGGKQYRVAAQDIIEIEKLTGDIGATVEFAEVLMVGGESGGEPRFGAPTVSGAKVTAEVVRQGRGEKVIIFKKRRRHTFRRKKGHRQELTTVRITAING